MKEFKDVIEYLLHLVQSKTMLVSNAKEAASWHQQQQT
jgi:hypothetical protein